jgi:hypothetical protein
VFQGLLCSRPLKAEALAPMLRNVLRRSPA